VVLSKRGKASLPCNWGKMTAALRGGGGKMGGQRDGGRRALMKETVFWAGKDLLLKGRLTWSREKIGGQKEETKARRLKKKGPLP